MKFLLWEIQIRRHSIDGISVLKDVFMEPETPPLVKEVINSLLSVIASNDIGAAHELFFFCQDFSHRLYAKIQHEMQQERIVH